ncbi:MAG: GrpB family protein [Planctomycetota bacterium]
MTDMPPVRLSHYDPRWRQEFEQTRSSIFFSVEGWIRDIHHIGSTSISGMIARPTIDVVAIVEDTEAQEEAAGRIEGLNFRRIAPEMWSADAIRLRKPRNVVEGEFPTHQVWVVIEESLTLKRMIAIRDFLREHRDESLRFEETKVNRWRQGEGDPELYQRDKSVFFAHLEERLGLA